MGNNGMNILAKKRKHVCLILLLILCMLFMVGCGKLGEKEAESIVKKACRIPDSFVKVNYQVDEKTGLAFLDFKAKNALGVEIPGRAYFKVTKDKVEGIDTEGVPPNVVEEFAKNNPNEFAECVASYKKLESIVNKSDFDFKMFRSSLDDLEVNNNNYFTWSSLKKQTLVINRRIKQFNEAAKNAPPSVLKHFEKFPRTYFNVILNGDYMSGWNAEFKKGLTEYPNKD